MSAGAIAHSRADVAISVTGIAGPGGETPGKPVSVWFTSASPGAVALSGTIGASFRATGRRCG